jgi:hypothetical protein
MLHLGKFGLDETVDACPSTMGRENGSPVDLLNPGVIRVEGAIAERRGSMPDFITLHVLKSSPFGVEIDDLRWERLSGVELDVIVQRDVLSAAIGDELFLEVEAGMIVELDFIPAIAESVYIPEALIPADVF